MIPSYFKSEILAKRSLRMTLGLKELKSEICMDIYKQIKMSSFVYILYI